MAWYQRGVPLDTTSIPTDASQAESWVDSTSLRKLFRVLVVTSTLLYILFFFEHIIFGRWITDIEFEMLDQTGYNALIEFPGTFYNLLFLLWIAAAIGMCTFSAAARVLYLTLFLFGTATCLTSGLVASTPFASFVTAVSASCDAAALTLAYLSPLRTRFR